MSSALTALWVFLYLCFVLHGRWIPPYLTQLGGCVSSAGSLELSFASAASSQVTTAWPSNNSLYDCCVYSSSADHAGLGCNGGWVRAGPESRKQWSSEGRRQGGQEGWSHHQQEGKHFRQAGAACNIPQSLPPSDCSRKDLHATTSYMSRHTSNNLTMFCSSPLQGRLQGRAVPVHPADTYAWCSVVLATFK